MTSRTKVAGSQGPTVPGRGGGSLVGTVVDGKYRVGSVLGKGAMGVVYGGTHEELGRRVALKTLHPELAVDPTLLDRFEQEARAAGAIGHPNIVQVFDLGRLPGGGRYMVMEYLDGQNLGAVLAESGPIPVARAVALFDQLLSALGAAHDRGIVHRDLKPENVVVMRIDEGDHLKIVDFGISKVLQGAADQLATGKDKTAFGSLLGTPAYMAPEQARGQSDLDHRCDIWACGIVLYELLVGRVPWKGESFQQVLAEILESTVPPLPAGAVPEAVAGVIRRALSRDREARYQSCKEMRAALRRAVGQDADSPEPASDDRALLEALETADLSMAVSLDGEPGGGSDASEQSYGTPSRENSPLVLETRERRFVAGFDGNQVQLEPVDPERATSRKRPLLFLVVAVFVAVAVAVAAIALT